MGARGRDEGREGRMEGGRAEWREGGRRARERGRDGWRRGGRRCGEREKERDKEERKSKRGGNEGASSPLLSGRGRVMELARVSDASDAWLRTGVGGLVESLVQGLVQGWFRTERNEKKSLRVRRGGVKESLVLTLFSVTEYNLVALRTTGAQGNQVA